MTGHTHSPIAADLTPLEQYAPALDNHLRKVFNAASVDYQELHALFDYCFLNGGREENCLPRREDESFNPRLARLAQLLISECREHSKTMIGAAFLTTIPQSQLQAAPADLAMRQLAEAVFQGNATALPEAVGITLVLYLDQVRHLHQSNRTREEITHLLANARIVIGHPIAENRYNTLKTMLTHAISQQERRCTR